MQMLYRLSYEGAWLFRLTDGSDYNLYLLTQFLERATGFEPATLSLEG